MWIFSALLVVLLSSRWTSTSPLTKDGSVCARTFCGAGRECVSSDRGEPVCRCLQRCAGLDHWVCGSDGRSYRNHCEMHRHACRAGTRVREEHPGHCKEELAAADVSPIVCFLSDRDWLRERLIVWVREEAESNRSSSDAAPERRLLQEYFQLYDDGDRLLDSTEFLGFLTALNLTFSHTPQENNLLLRSLCVDALIELSDENTDWKLSSSEFVNCLTASYQPPERKCALEDEVFEDGAETQMECNKCVCACGNWVCTALTCNGEHLLEEVVQDGGEEEEMTEEEWSRRVAQLNAVQEHVAMET